MAIEFSEKRWDYVMREYEAFWEGKATRPLAHVTLYGADPGRPAPDVPPFTMEHMHDFSYTADQVIDRIDYEICCCKYIAQGFPIVNMGMFGPGVVAAFLGAKVDNRTGTVWFHPPDGEIDIHKLRFSYDPDNIWLERIRSLYVAGTKRWEGQVVMTMTDLGGVLDILASFLTTEGLLLALIEEPEEVERLASEITSLWRKYYDEFAALMPNRHGCAEWGHMLSAKRTFMLQNDVTYMISPKLFERFALPGLREICGWLPRSFYHLDGVGQLPHLDALLSIGNLTGIQWIPGGNKPTAAFWPEVLKKIRDGGKLAQTFDLWNAKLSVDALDGGAGLHIIGSGNIGDEDAIKRILDESGIEH